MADQLRILLKWTAEPGVHHHKLCSLTRVPSCGEYIILDEDNHHEYKVMMVVHIAQPADYAAELFVQRSLYDLEEEL